MNIGKLDSRVLEAMLSKYTGYRRSDVPSLAKVGEDVSFIEVGRKTIVLTTDPVTAAKTNIGTIGFNINMNDLATSGAEGIGLLVTILLPPETDASELETIMKEIHEEAFKNKMQILGGHTEVTKAVNRIVISVTAIGLTDRGEEIRAGNARVGDTLVVSKVLGIEGTYIVASDFKDKLLNVLSPDELDHAVSMGASLSVAKEGQIGRLAGVHAMHDITEGGVKGAVWEMANASNKGSIIYEKDLPFDPVTLKICGFIGIDPLRLISSGSMLFATDDPEELIRLLNEAGITGTVIGKVTEEYQKIVIDDLEKELEPPGRDEIYRLFENE